MWKWQVDAFLFVPRMLTRNFKLQIWKIPEYLYPYLENGISFVCQNVRWVHVTLPCPFAHPRATFGAVLACSVQGRGRVVSNTLHKSNQPVVSMFRALDWQRVPKTFRSRALSRFYSFPLYCSWPESFIFFYLLSLGCFSMCKPGLKHDKTGNMAMLINCCTQVLFGLQPCKHHRVLRQKQM